MGESTHTKNQTAYTHTYTHAAELTLHLAECEHENGLHGRDGPRHQMEQMGPVLDRFVTPLEAGGEEPGQCQTGPPGERGHAAEVEGHEEHGAGR